MLKNPSKNREKQPQFKPESELIPDPWEEPMSPLAPEATPKFHELRPEPLRLSPPGRDPEGQLLTAASLSPLQVLLRDELKLKACMAGKLKTQIQAALALLCWLGCEQGHAVS